ncbi:DUF3953 domain-containing protein [Gracilibacillus salinarum]|uniref:DUF3953 domain-containing protein n=1 Tax=Gracilibacillus salinarum TaxID=2932255 RepID=A0ABY4GGU3_9BACI|nr:DUF3953 domain-containing protein [Gracilibacillus salinarum]UOQ83548.1 DUF3953 domain-containing protein [Gracilibacillus salinarum]
MKILRIILAIVVVSFSCYGLIVGENGNVLPFTLLLAGLMLFFVGVVEFKERKPIAFTTFLAAGFSLFVGIYTL